MRSPFHRRRFDSAASLLTAPRGMGYLRVGLGGLSPLGQAIATAEGANPATNNPGNLELGNAFGLGTWQAAGGQQITIFPTLEAGQAALENQINLIATGRSTAGYDPSMSIAQVGAIYSGSSNGNWANNVAAAMGVSPDTNFASLAGGGSVSAAASSLPSSPDSDLSDSSLDLSSLTDLLGDSGSSGVSPWVIGGLAAAALAAAYAFA